MWGRDEEVRSHGHKTVTGTQCQSCGVTACGARWGRNGDHCLSDRVSNHRAAHLKLIESDTLNCNRKLIHKKI